MPSKDEQNRICGFLHIDEEDKREKFRRRYFVLNKSKGVLEWYDDKPTDLVPYVQPCGTVNLSYITKVDEAKRLKRSFCFVINTPFRPYYVQACNQADVEEWVEILNDAGKIIVPPEAMHPPPSNPPRVEGADIKVPTSCANDVNTSSKEQTATYKMDVIGNVIVKRQFKDETEMPQSPTTNSTGSERKFPFSDNSAGLLSGDDKNIIKRGWAVKQGHVRRNWKRRYFILKSEGFAYFKSEHDKEPIRTIPINEVLAAKTEEGDNTMKLRDNLLLVATTDRIYYMQTDSPEEMNDWISAFNNAITTNRHKNKKHQVKKKISATKSAAVTKHGVNKPTLLATSQFSSTNNLIHTSPHSKTISSQSCGFRRSVDMMGETHVKTVRPLSYIGKGQSIQLVDFKTTSWNSVDYSTYSSDSLDVSLGSSPQRRDIKLEAMESHKRSDSETSASPKRAAESTSHRRRRDRLQNQHRSNSEVSCGATASKPIQTTGSVFYSHPTSQPNGHNAAQFDSSVDMRGVIKPSSVKKKNNSGIMFAINAMLHRKQDKIKKNS